ncbi:hypothetical protein J3E64_002336 [Sphingobium sp. OAS761]|uniref:hypothetical protein n=1 Tax=Sphingobium sp. OAS761 TaxID=2817901 RepID=UPI00209E15FD|nr:hypothetical protein [Sphingobium sp. OAS761]MCP1470648.1 hypothetical protein [Sphingobium sp. OAS761]
MFAFIAAALFGSAFLLAMGTIGWMLVVYRDKMAAALLFEPIPEHPPVYNLRVRRTRPSQACRPMSVAPIARAAAA